MSSLTGSPRRSSLRHSTLMSPRSEDGPNSPRVSFERNSVPTEPRASSTSVDLGASDAVARPSTAAEGPEDSAALPRASAASEKRPTAYLVVAEGLADPNPTTEKPRCYSS